MAIRTADDATPSPVAPPGACPVSRIGAEFNPFHGAQLEDPYPFYARARREEPVFYSPVTRMWYVTRYDDIVAVLRDPARFSSAQSVDLPLDFTPETREAIRTSYLSRCSLIDNDPPSHTQIRRMVNKAFAARRTADLEARVRAIAADLIDRFAARGHADLVEELAFPLPMRVILSVLGAPEGDLGQLKRWSDDWMTLVAVQLTPERQREVVGRLLESERYWTSLIEERRARPRDDLLSDLLEASQEEQPPVPLLQLVNVCAVLVLAGHETTMNLLGLCVHRLLREPDAWRLVCEDPANIPGAVEETLRADTSVHALMRTTMAPVEVGGVKLPKGAQLALLFASANHDEAHFQDGAQFDLRREDAARHLAFGHGIHYCVGAQLARLEVRVALELLIERLPGLRLVPDQEITYVVNPIHRGLKALQIAWDTRGDEGARHTLRA
ncbi:cytochrome P450 [Sorangium cellulosum]|uniref:Cytochrome P450 n=1 Tax=Sorangium cellulosum TaxID=56 RepID=A0A4P2Q597_SORCE|nr:cytochrome P450 [Sorangium cellulosum]AUX24587.1 cytochrome P450 [Sorangium cellulosum]